MASFTVVVKKRVCFKSRELSIQFVIGIVQTGKLCLQSSVSYRLIWGPEQWILAGAGLD